MKLVRRHMSDNVRTYNFKPCQNCLTLLAYILDMFKSGNPDPDPGYMHRILTALEVLISIKSSPEKQSTLDAIEHLLARKREMRPLFFWPARPMNVEWKMSPYLGVLPLVFRAL